MLRDYEKDDVFCADGFCALLNDKYRISIYGLRHDGSDQMRVVLPELERFRPQQYATGEGHWFLRGELAPRIAILKKVIRITKKQIQKI